MAGGGPKAVWIVSLALATLLLAFYMVRDCDGPDALEAPGRALTYICPNCACRFLVQLSEEEAANPEIWRDEVPCPGCTGMARRAEACTSCGAIVPTPADGILLGAKCPKCGDYLFGPPGGVMPLAAPPRGK